MKRCNYYKVNFKIGDKYTFRKLLHFPKLTRQLIGNYFGNILEDTVTHNYIEIITTHNLTPCIFTFGLMMDTRRRTGYFGYFGTK